MISMLKNWNGAVEVNGRAYDSVSSVVASEFEAGRPFTIVLHPQKAQQEKEADKSRNSVQKVEKSGEKRISVRAYMTKRATPEFDFMAKWNNDVPMPMRTMQGVVEKETRGMVYMRLHGFGEATVTCAVCGKELTNPVSRHYGIGPICLEKLGIVRDIEDVENIKEELERVEWSGWVIKSAITEEEDV